MPRLDIPVSQDQADAVKFSADVVGQSVSEYVRRRVVVGAEPGPYSFQGFSGDSLVRDLAMTSGHSSGYSREVDDALDRLKKFKARVADVSFAPQTTTSASQIIPPGYRPVAPFTLEANRPLYNATSHATITNAAPFSIPRTSSSDAVVPATRTEGNQPSGADPTFGTTAISPAGVSGLVDITRELADSASPGGDAVMLELLQEDLNRRIEEKIYTELNSTNGAGGVITAGFVPSGAMAIVDAAPTTGLLNTLRKQNLRFAAVRRQRPLNTVVGAAAADHLGGLLLDDSTSDEQAMYRVGGSAVNVAANAFATGAADARTLTLGVGDAWCFTSPVQDFRFDEQAGPALVRIAILQYVAVAIVRAVGISAVRFT